MQLNSKKSGMDSKSFMDQCLIIRVVIKDNHVVGLGLYNKGLTSLPETIGQLTSLKELWLTSNQLKSLPETIGQLTSLKELYLHENKLTSLPETIGQLTALEEL